MLSTPTPVPSTSAAPFNTPSPSHANPIDLTGDDSDFEDVGPQRKRFRSSEPFSRAASAPSSVPGQAFQQASTTSSPFFTPRVSSVKSMVIPAAFPSAGMNNFSEQRLHSGLHRAPTNAPNQVYRPAFAPPLYPSALLPPPPLQPPPVPAALRAPAPHPVGSMSQNTNGHPVIDLTNSPSPPPMQNSSFLLAFNTLPADLAPRTPVCIGMLSLDALILYPISYILPQPDSEWASVRLYKGAERETALPNRDVKIGTPQLKAPSGEIVYAGEEFGILEQRAASILGPMLVQTLIKLDGKIQRGKPSILPLRVLVFTPKGNVAFVGKYLRSAGLLLDHPTPPFDLHKLANTHYSNPHNPPPGGHARVANGGRQPVALTHKWSTPPVGGKSVQVDRSQVDEVFKSLRNGEDLEEADTPLEISTKLYPHQRRALTFLLEREREKPGPDGKFTSLWQWRFDPSSQSMAWFHAVTEKYSSLEPPEFRGAILADDMGLGKTIICVSLIAATLESSRKFASSPLPLLGPPPASTQSELSASHFSSAVWSMPTEGQNKAAKASVRADEKAMAEYTRNARIKVRSRASLIICPLSTVVNWEDQLRDHWAGEVQVVGGSGGSVCAVAGTSQALLSMTVEDPKPAIISPRKGPPLRVYVYHGNARRPDCQFLADFDIVITTYSTLATEYSKQSKSAHFNENDEEEESSDEITEVDEHGNQIIRLSAAKKTAKRKKGPSCSGVEVTSPLQSVYWFRVVLDEAHSIKETNTVCSRACCDLFANRRLCLTGTPIQNKLDDIFALIKFLRLEPFVEKAIWTEFIGTPAKFGQAIGIRRLQTIMKSITLRRTKESKASDGTNILSLPPRHDELRFLKFDENEQAIYDQFFTESKAEFNEMSNKNEVMKNYVGILQKILRLRQICDHFELVEGKLLDGPQSDSATNYDQIITAIVTEGLTVPRATAVFALLRDAGTAVCVECGYDMSAADANGLDATGMETDGIHVAKPRGRKGKTGPSRPPTRPSSPSVPRPILTRCQHLFCIACYRACVCPGWPSVPDTTRRSCSACQAGLGPLDAAEVDSSSLGNDRPKRTRKEKRPKGPIADRDFHPSTKVKALLADLIQFSRANPYSSNYDRNSMDGIQLVDQKGNDAVGDVVKTVVFSQWTSMLDKVEDALQAAQIRYDRLDGTMKRDERTRAMDALKHDLGCEVLLVSLKAGGVGLNLTAAQRVYLMDPYWNPAVENQAVDRIHRLGQTRPVTTVKLVIENTIEARLLQVQKKKMALANMTLSQQLTKAELMQRRMEELQELFR